ncbi:alpha/beta hydrolase [Pedobacter frigiditerrae]|uniref:Alpha/beta hydrolase n=1 Tax=Pedobacter frigiditerrae TaxID=2530452 RepID=A0A4R0MQE4_9SPHI|nr:prolyl oligopeptidase family serine peptidase [Pedobacter frigiditerrae]TCC89075.1 alpha/beta hydrolase [Pedobacter frigiditerrae]
MMRYLFLFLLYLGFTYSAMAQQHITEEKTVKWHHFDKTEFKFNGLSAWVIAPKKAIAGNPWVWKAYFPDWHTQPDSILLERGFHVAYLQTNDLFGHAKALDSWDQFYEYLIAKKAFAQKVALEGISRGGLYVYGWSKRNPTKVSCIYAEAPVCDFNSWPGGKGTSKGSVADWKKLLTVYNLTEEEASQYKDQPKDNLDQLAALKVPILHVIGLDDRIVPIVENTMLLVQNYILKGGPATVIPMTKGIQSLEGHHFPIENPAAIADFIYRNSVPDIKH